MKPHDSVSAAILSVLADRWTTRAAIFDKLHKYHLSFSAVQYQLGKMADEGTILRRLDAKAGPRFDPVYARVPDDPGSIVIPRNRNVILCPSCGSVRPRCEVSAPLRTKPA